MSIIYRCDECQGEGEKAPFLVVMDDIYYRTEVRHHFCGFYCFVSWSVKEEAKFRGGNNWATGQVPERLLPK